MVPPASLQAQSTVSGTSTFSAPRLRHFRDRFHLPLSSVQFRRNLHPSLALVSASSLSPTFSMREQLNSRAAGLTAASAPATSSGTMETSTPDLPEVMTEFMVEMSCEGCVKNVRRNLEQVNGVQEMSISLEDKVVRVRGTSALQQLEEGLKKTGLRSRLIGQGDPDKLELTAAVAEFKGPAVFGVVRFTQVNMDTARVEAQFDGLQPNSSHGWSVNEFGDLTRGADSTGGHYNPTGEAHGGPDSEVRHAGDLGNLIADEHGHATYSAANDKLKVWDLIGRSVVVYQGADDLGLGGTESSKSAGGAGSGLAAAVIARSAGVGQNYKSLCTCDGTVIWEATPSDYVQQQQK